MPGPVSPSSGTTGPGLAQLFDAELADLGVEDTELVPDLRAHVLAAIDGETAGPEPQPTLSVDQAGAVAFSVLTGVTSLAGSGEAGGPRALALRRADELAALQAEIVTRRAEDVASMTAVQLARTVLRRRPRRRARRNDREETR